MSPFTARIQSLRLPLLPLMLAFAIVAVGISIFVGFRHDYVHYAAQWDWIMEGKNPWAELPQHLKNAYGPLHNAIALLYTINDYLPKILFALCGVLTSYLLLNRTDEGGAIRLQPSTVFVTLAFVLHPITLFVCYYFSINDSVCALLLVLALIAREKNHLVSAGILIGVAALLKFYPIIFAPFLMITAPRVITLRPMIAAVATFVVGMAAAYLIWGTDIFAPLLFASDRGASYLSIFRFVQGRPDLFGGPEVVQSILASNTLILLGIAVIVFLFLFFAGANWLTAMVIGVASILLFYKAAHRQFYLPWIATYAFMIASTMNPEMRRIARNLCPGIICLAVTTAFIYSNGRFEHVSWEFLQTHVSIPTFIFVGGGVVASLLPYARNLRLSFRLRW